MQESKPHYATTNGGGARFVKRSEPPPPQPLFVPSGHVAFRLLCHASRIGGVIGWSGSIIKQLQQQTSAKIRIEDSLPGPDDRRVIFVIASAVVEKKIIVSASTRATSSHCQEDERQGLHDVEEAEVEVSLAQEALVRVFERVIEVSAETDGFGNVAGGLSSCRLLVAQNQVGSVIGIGGNVVEKIRKETGCRIKALKVENLQHFPSITDEIIEIEGDLLGVKRALVAVTRCLQDHPPNVDRTMVQVSRKFEAVPSRNAFDPLDKLPSQRAPSINYSSAASSCGFAPNGHRLSTEDERIFTTATRMPQKEVSFKILCPNDKVGSVIGRGGSIVKSIKADTGASISVGPPSAECDNSVVTISAMENLNLGQSMAQNATMLVFRRFADAFQENEYSSVLVGSQVSVGLVIPSNQVGCLLGKGGAIVSEMRKMTATGIQIRKPNQVRECISENDEVVQITGKFANVQDALYKVMTRLRENLIATKPPSNTDNSPYARFKEPPQLGFSSPVGVSHPLTQKMDKLRLSQSERGPQSVRPWISQAQEGVNNKADGGLKPPKIDAELGRSVFVKNTTTEIEVPEDVVGSLFGENGSNLERLRQISGAKVVVMHEPQPGKAVRTIVLSGSRDETVAAESLLHAFIISGSK